MSPHYVRNGFHTVTPYFIAESADSLVDFVVGCFDGRINDMQRNDEGRIRHAELQIGDSIIEVSEANSKYPPVQQTIHLYVSNVDETYRKCLEAGAVSLEEPADKTYGERGAGIRDGQGNQWFLATCKPS
ncbi:glyoxalase [Paenibacillus albidus]|uniref:Glyoxalase n=1 Tax=Paenibacillus albidus TaxID=2041023 RepID=A0A917CET9_9BACL|nr:VOC family protein [Paenibacillus albidus]GGF86148.1 glyoxalase [Paenibacillus albidus]